MSVLQVACSVLALWVCGALIGLVLPEQMRRPDETEVLSASERVPSATLVGEFSSGLAAYLWRKTDEYTHSGVLMRPMTAREREGGVHADCTHDHHDEHQAAGSETVSVIPHKANDPRGIWGDLEREVRPYFDEHSHQHRPPEETLPLFRFMTWLDPKFVPGYTVGAFVIRRAVHSEAEVKLFLREGLRYNPRSVALRVEFARCLMRERAPIHEVTGLLEEAIVLGRSSEMAEWDKEGLQDAYRWLAIVLRHEGRVSEARRIAAEGLRAFPDDRVLHRLSGLRGSP